MESSELLFALIQCVLLDFENKSKNSKEKKKKQIIDQC